MTGESSESRSTHGPCRQLMDHDVFVQSVPRANPMQIEPSTAPRLLRRPELRAKALAGCVSHRYFFGVREQKG